MNGLKRVFTNYSSEQRVSSSVISRGVYDGICKRVSTKVLIWVVSQKLISSFCPMWMKAFLIIKRQNTSTTQQGGKIYEKVYKFISCYVDGIYSSWM